MSKRISWVVLACSAGCTAHASCGKQRSVDKAKLEGQVKEWVIADGGNPTSVTCPDEVAKNVTFGCEVELEGEKTYFVDVDDDKPDEPVLRWRGGGAIHREKLVELFKLNFGEEMPAPTLECEPLLYGGLQTQIKCPITVGGAKTTFIVNEQGGRLDPPLLMVEKLESFVEANLETPGQTATCGATQMIARPADGVVLCDVSGGPQPQQVKMVFDPELKMTALEVVSP